MTKPQFLWVSTRADSMVPNGEKMTDRDDTVVDDGMLPSHRARVGASPSSASPMAKPAALRCICSTAASRPEYSASSAKRRSAAERLLSRRDGVGM